jgi:hypothetical protein
MIKKTRIAEWAVRNDVEGAVRAMASVEDYSAAAENGRRTLLAAAGGL